MVVVVVMMMMMMMMMMMTRIRIRKILKWILSVRLQIILNWFRTDFIGGLLWTW
jgi:hypothetical protein